MLTLRAASRTDTGRVRSLNQDCALVDDNLIAVADGMGGHAGGEVAAQMAIEVLQRSFESRRGLDGLVAAAQRANREVFQRSERDKNLRGMGTTLTAAAIVPTRKGERLALVNVGDSRAYLHDGERLEQLTHDHSLVEEMTRSGELSAEEAAVHPHRHILTRALGIDRSVEMDSWLLEPEISTRLLICSDGLTNECSEEEIAAVLREIEDPAAAAEELVSRALEHGGSDNVTVVIADITGEGSETTRGTRRSAAAPPESALGAAVPVTSHLASVVGDPTAPAATAAATAPASLAPLLAGIKTGKNRHSKSQKDSNSSPRQQRARPKRQYREHIITPGVVLFIFVLLAVLAGAAGFVDWFAKATYYVGLRGDRVTIFQGRPGGILWFHPSVVEQTTLTTASVFPPSVPVLRSGILESSLSNARQVVNNLANQKSFFALPGASSTTTTSSSLVTTTTMSVSSTTAAQTTTTKPKG